MKQRETYEGRIAEYLDGRMSAADVAAFDRACAADPLLAAEVASLRPVARELSAPERRDNFRLSADRLALIRAAASGHIVEFPTASGARAQRVRSGLAIYRRLYPTVAAAAAVVIGALAGFNSGRESFDSTAQSFEVATQLAMPAAEIQSDDAVHLYSPVYNLDHHVDWPSHRTATIGFAKSAPPNYGLPGPRPVYLVGSEIVPLQ